MNVLRMLRKGDALRRPFRLLLTMNHNPDGVQRAKFPCLMQELCEMMYTENTTNPILNINGHSVDDNVSVNGCATRIVVRLSGNLDTDNSRRKHAETRIKK